MMNKVNMKQWAISRLNLNIIKLRIDQLSIIDLTPTTISKESTLEV